MGTPAGSDVRLVVAIDFQVVVHAATAWQQRHIHDQLFRTNESIGIGSQLRKCGRLHGAIAASPGPGLPLRPVGDKIRQSVLTGPVVVDPLLIVIF